MEIKFNIIEERKEVVVIKEDLVIITILRASDKLFTVNLYVNNTAYKTTMKTLLEAFNNCVAMFINEKEEYELDIKFIDIINQNICNIGYLIEVLTK